MDAKDIRNLQEAYLEVYSEELEQLDEISNRLAGRVLNARIAATGAASDRAYMHRNPQAMRAAETTADKEAKTRNLLAKRNARLNRGTQQEQVDIYDIILSYLLDEGYAETPESAEAIMVNMSEEWRDSIIDEEQLDEMRKEDKVKGEKKTPLHTTVTRTLPGKVEKPPGGSWKKVSDSKTFTNTALSPRAATSRMKQGMIDKETQPYATRMPGAARQAHGGGGSGAEAPGRLRGVRRTATIQQRRERQPDEGLTPQQKLRLQQAQQERSTSGRNT